jgi:hypothetical protein
MSAHQPFLDHQARIGVEFVARCLGCRWAQIIDEDLHEDSVDELLAWHVHQPQQGLDHLTGDGLAGALEIPPYVHWGGRDGLLDLTDERTGGRHSGYNHACLTVFSAVAAGRPLEDPVASEARRLGLSQRRARADVVAVAASLYRRGCCSRRRPLGISAADHQAPANRPRMAARTDLLVQ